MNNERAPLLSDTVFAVLKDMRTFQWGEGFKEATSIYEAKITSGELAVVKTARRSFNSGGGKELWQCCGECRFEPMPDSFNFCPGCGAKIVDA